MEGASLAGPTTAELWAALRADLERFFRSRVRDPAAADDLLQETFARVHAGLADLRRADRLAPWVFAIARRALVDHRRRRADAALAPEDVAQAGAEDGNLNAEVLAWLPGFLAQLPAEQREALELAELEGLSARAIAARLGLSLPAAKARVQRGRARLRAELEACCRFELDRRGNVVDYERRAPGCDC